MTPLSIIICAFLAALVVSSFSFMGGAVPVALPAAALLIAAIGWGVYAKRRTTPPHSTPRYEREKDRAEDGDPHPAGDPSTLYTNTPQARAQARAH